MKWLKSQCYQSSQRRINPLYAISIASQRLFQTSAFHGHGIPIKIARKLLDAQKLAAVFNCPTSTKDNISEGGKSNVVWW